MKHAVRLAGAAALLAFATTGLADTEMLRARLNGCAALDRRLAEVSRLDKAVEYSWDAIATPDAVRARQDELRGKFIAAIGGLPNRTPLEPSVRAVVRRDGYRIEKLTFASRPHHHVTAHLFLPEDPKFAAPYPAILVACGHSGNGKALRNYQRACVQGVKAGFAVFIYDPIDQGERTQLPDTDKKNVGGHVHLGMRAHLLGWSTAQFRIWDGMRAIDYLETRPEVDASRIGMMGQSGGGTLTAYVSAMDTRIKASCPSCYICSVRTLAEDWGPQDCEQILQGQLTEGLNHLSLALMVWPRPLRITLAEEDAFPFRGSLSTFASAKMFYNRFGTGDKIGYISAPGPHSWYESTRQGSVEWMKRWLRGDSDVMTKEALAKLDNGFSFDKVDCALGDDPAANVLPEGGVMGLPGERSAYDFLRDELARIDKAGRPPLTRELVRRVTGIRMDAPVLPDEPLEYTRGTYWARFHSSADELAAMDVWLGTSLVARKAEQMIARARTSGVRRRLVASGADCIAAAHAWYLAPELFDGIELSDRPLPWRAYLEDVRRDGLKMQMLVYGALRSYDWPDLLSAAPPSDQPQVSHFDELVPRPRSCRAAESGASAPLAALHVTESRGEVPNAPAAVADQAYRLEISAAGAKIVAGGDAGARYARTTLAQLARLGGGRVPCGVITDWPELRYRGYMVDCGRNWQPLSAIRELLGFMADYKLNLFHWHLTDYWGWRLASKAVPELSSDKATIRNVGCRYSQEDFVAVVDYAAKLGITVMPEFDVPGHTQAFRAAIGVDSMADPKADAAVKAFLDEFVALVPPNRMPYIHLGTDEVRNEPEKVDHAVVREWARHAAARGHSVVGWSPGIALASEGVDYVEMQWGGKLESRGHACFDMTRRYIDVVDPFELLGMAAYVKPCAWDISEDRKLGGVIGGWHDDVLGSPEEYFRNDAVLPAIVLNSDAFWSGRDADRPKFRSCMPRPSDPAFDIAADLERRVIAQRDRVLGDGGRMPFPFLGQTSMRWRISQADGTLIAEDVPQATLRFRTKRCPSGFSADTNAAVVAETWIRSPVEQKVGAWIGFTAFSKSSGRAIDNPTPKIGEWNRHGATVELNGVKLEPPKWTNPGLTLTAEDAKRPHFWGSCAISTKIPMTDEEYWMREPYPITLRRGWNHVKLTMPPPDPEPYAHRHAWCGTFIPMAGTSAHPREVPGLEYRAQRPADYPLDGISFAVPRSWPCPELDHDGLKALWLEGEPYDGRPTRVFAYLALPADAAADRKSPGMVLAHGGGGTAYPSWAKTWAKRGYAAIVVDNCGAMPLRAPGAKGWTRSGVGGPAGWGRFELGLEPPEKQWPYQAVGALVRAHSYLRSLPEVDADRTGLTGISWGGYLTMLTAATDKRFKLAMPVYACGYYDEIGRYSGFYDKRSRFDARAVARWDELFDSKHYAAQMDLPVFWFASSNDAAFPFDLLQRTVRLPKRRPALAVRVRMVHSHGPNGENMPELFLFADNVLNGAPDLPVVGLPELSKGEIWVRFDAKGHALKRVDLNWCSAEPPRADSRWETAQFPVPDGDVFRAKVPDGATRAYVNFVMDRQTGEALYPEALVSSRAVRIGK